MEGNEMNEDVEDVINEEDIVRVIPLDDTINGLARPPEVAGDGDGNEDTTDFGENMERDAVSDAVDTAHVEDFTHMITEADTIISACKEEAFVVSCFRDRWLAVGGKDDQAVLYNLQRNSSEPALRIDEHKDSVICAQFNAKGHLLATGDMTGLIVISSTPVIKKCCMIDDCEELSWMQWHSSADILLAGGKNGIWMWLVSNDGVQQTKVYLCDSPAISVDGKLLADGKRLLSCYEDGSVRLWSLKDEKSVEITTGAGSATYLDVHHSLPVAVIGDLVGRCYLVSMETAKVLRIFNVTERTEATEPSEVTVECVKFCPGKEPWFAVGTNSGRFSIYDFSAGTLRHILMSNLESVVDCRWYLTASDELYVMAACYSGVVRIWNGRDGNPFLALLSRSIAEQDSHLLSMDLSVEGPELYTAYTSGQFCKFSFVNR